MESDQVDMVLGSDFVGNNLYCVFYDYGERLRLKELSSSDANYELGEYPVNTEDDIIYPQVMQISENNGKVYIEIAWYEGDLVHLENVTILEVTPEKSNSVKMIYEGVPENLNEYASPYFYFNADDEIIFEDYDPPIVMLTEETYGDLVFFDSYFGATMIKEQMIPEYPFDEDKEGIPVTIFQCAEKTGNSIFAITAEGIYDSEENFNWQMIYVFDRFDYIIFEPDGNGGYTEKPLKPEIK